jgi:hypothetical protein
VAGRVAGAAVRVASIRVRLLLLLLLSTQRDDMATLNGDVLQRACAATLSRTGEAALGGEARLARSVPLSRATRLALLAAAASSSAPLGGACVWSCSTELRNASLRGSAAARAAAASRSSPSPASRLRRAMAERAAREVGGAAVVLSPMRAPSALPHASTSLRTIRRAVLAGDGARSIALLLRGLLGELRPAAAALVPRACDGRTTTRDGGAAAQSESIAPSTAAEVSRQGRRRGECEGCGERERHPEQGRATVHRAPRTTLAGGTRRVTCNQHLGEAAQAGRGSASRAAAFWRRRVKSHPLLPGRLLRCRASRQLAAAQRSPEVPAYASSEGAVRRMYQHRGGRGGRSGSSRCGWGAPHAAPPE